MTYLYTLHNYIIYIVTHFIAVSEMQSAQNEDIHEGSTRMHNFHL